MSDVFPKWTNTLPLKIAVGVVLVGTAVTAGSWYYLTPKYSRVGYQPTQPVGFSHATHAGPRVHPLALGRMVLQMLLGRDLSDAHRRKDESKRHGWPTAKQELAKTRSAMG